MHGLMMDRQLLISAIIDHAASYHQDTEVVSVNTNGGQHRTNYAEIRRRALKLASVFNKRGLDKSDRIATIAWNNYRHVELYYAISGNGQVCHTINPRLFVDQLSYIINHAEDRIVFFDATFLPLVDGIREKLKTVEAFVLMEPRDEEIAENYPWIEFYEDLIDGGDDEYQWPDGLDEKDASSLCYTSGTTGNPKGVLYSHRSTLIHAMMSATPDVVNLSARDCLLPVVPMFHVNAWGTAYAAPMMGTKLVMSGPNLDGKSIVSLFNQEKVTVSAGVPTIWLGLISYLEQSGEKLPFLERTVVGGSACPPSMIDKFRDSYDVEVLHAWGMTELSPLGTVNNLKNKHADLAEEDREKLRLNQGRPAFGIELGVFDDDDNRLPENGDAQGNLYCRGYWVLDKYFRSDVDDLKQGDWFPTGDVATVDEDGFMTIRDRSKDIIKSGGEWISTVELENLALGHPAIADAAVVAAQHPKWDERPLLLLVQKPDASFTQTDMNELYDGKVAKWWVPDAFRIIDEIPRNATGKVRKNLLRETYGNALVEELQI